MITFEENHAKYRRIIFRCVKSGPRFNIPTESLRDRFNELADSARSKPKFSEESFLAFDLLINEFDSYQIDYAKLSNEDLF